MQYGKDRDYCIDLIPKFLMASGEFVDILSNLDLSRYIEFVQIDGSFVFRDGKGICKVPSTPTEAATSSLMGFFEKRRAKNFFQFCANLDLENPLTWNKLNLHVVTMGELFKSYDLDSNTIDFIGHALALHSNDSYLREPALLTVQKIKLYMESMLRFGKTPYLYPLYGLGELPQGFARLSAIYGGTYMLGIQFEGFQMNESEQVCGVKVAGNNEVFKARRGVICDPSYAPERVCLSQRVIRAICLLDHPIKSAADSCQIILPQKQLNRHHDIYISCLSGGHNVCPPGYFLAQISTIVETANPEQEISPALTLLGPILEKFVSISNLYEPLTDGRSDGIFVSKSLDSSTHFETVCEDVKNIYDRIFQKPLQVSTRPTAEEEQSMHSTSVGVYEV
jgi:Rab GDP dissociation inhibitor